MRKVVPPAYGPNVPLFSLTWKPILNSLENDMSATPRQKTPAKDLRVVTSSGVHVFVRLGTGYAVIGKKS
jgi:hypothetical protein